MTGKTVYIVMRCEWGEGGYPVEVHISKEKAEQRKEAMNDVLQADGSKTYYAEVVAMVVGKEIDDNDLL